jgi:hypothetical protein
MPVSARSRYAPPATLIAPDAKGVDRACLPIRRYSPPAGSSASYAHLLTGAESLEYLAWRYQGASDAWWRVAEGNALRFPLDWRPGEQVQVTSSDTQGLVVRDRRF